jgi:hypothetical protein
MYRSQRGEYPETLEQVRELIPDNVPVLIYDSTEVRFGPGREYFYERVGAEKYFLRSVGADGVAFTEDDIVPEAYRDGGAGVLFERPSEPEISAPSESQPLEDAEAAH